MELDESWQEVTRGNDLALLSGRGSAFCRADFCRHKNFSQQRHNLLLRWCWVGQLFVQYRDLWSSLDRHNWPTLNFGYKAAAWTTFCKQRCAWHHSSPHSQHQRVSFTAPPLPVSTQEMYPQVWNMIPLLSFLFISEAQATSERLVSLRHIPSQMEPQPRLWLQYVISSVSVGLDCVITFGKRCVWFLTISALPFQPPLSFTASSRPESRAETNSETWKRSSYVTESLLIWSLPAWFCPSGSSVSLCDQKPRLRGVIGSQRLLQNHPSHFHV